jgi:FixJ family two-component response regulator
MTLSEREREVLALLGAGHTNREIGARLVLTSGGHRRLTPDAVRRLAAERGPQPTVEPLPRRTRRSRAWPSASVRTARRCGSA